MNIKGLGLPVKFQAWRDGQEEAVEKLRADLYEHKFVFYDGPTGSGKSLVSLAVASCIALENRIMSRLENGKRIKPRCIYVTRTKQLQTQILNEFKKARGIKGRSNYPCALQPDKFPEFSAEDCYQNVAECSKGNQCLYYRTKKEACAAPISVLNYSYFLAEANGVGFFSGADILILDELDSLEGELMNYIQFTVSTKQLQRFKLPLPEEDSWEGWRSWAVLTRKTVVQKMETLNQQSPHSPGSSFWGTTELINQKKLTAFTKFFQQLESFLDSADPTSWVYTSRMAQDGNKTWVFSPIFVNSAVKLFSAHGDKILGMSGTILDPGTLASNLGISDWSYFKATSPFKIENRPIHFVPAADLIKKNMEEELPKLVSAVENILNLFPKDKILVHTTSYPIRDYLQFRLDLSRVITHNASNRTEKLEEFKRSLEPLVMLSPSFDRGVDLPNSDCRVVIIAKIPYADLGNKQIKARMRSPGGDRWYLLKTVQTLVQMTGRGVRSKDDFCRCFILDKQFSKVYRRASHLFPDWWRDALTNDLSGASSSPHRIDS